MFYLEFREKFKNYPVFSVDEIKKTYPDFDNRRLFEWQAKGYILKIRNNWYYFTDTEINENFLYLVVNKIYAPSYVSFESALSYYNLIPERVFSITSATSLKTNQFKTNLGILNYRHVKPGLYFGYRLFTHMNVQIRIAEIEKAVIDYFYLKPKLKDTKDFRELRININEFNNQMNMTRFKSYLKQVDSNLLNKRINNFLNFIDNA